MTPTNKQTALDKLYATIDKLTISLLIAQTIQGKLPRTYHFTQSGYNKHEIEHNNKSVTLIIDNETTNVGGIKTNLSDPDCITKTIKNIKTNLSNPNCITKTS